MRRGIDPEAKTVLRRWFSDSTLERVVLAFGEQTLLLADAIHRIFKVSAVVLGDTISIYVDEFEDTSPVGLGLLAHELEHIVQCEREGGSLIFWAKYLFYIALGLLKYGRGYLGPIQYRTHPFERPAIEREIEVLESLGAKKAADGLRRWLEKD